MGMAAVRDAFPPIAERTRRAVDSGVLNPTIFCENTVGFSSSPLLSFEWGREGVCFKYVICVCVYLCVVIRSARWWGAGWCLDSGGGG
mmetsp:Transcript_25727/g.64804  ORF Transcript_25727/g.64804 Transcript_25727/m.64804 type:complete len:88 (+) Transcript_25727:2512-2775(+)